MVQLTRRGRSILRGHRMMVVAMEVRRSSGDGAKRSWVRSNGASRRMLIMVAHQTWSGRQRSLKQRERLFTAVSVLRFDRDGGWDIYSARGCVRCTRIIHSSHITGRIVAMWHRWIGVVVFALVVHFVDLVDSSKVDSQFLKNDGFDSSVKTAF